MEATAQPGMETDRAGTAPVPVIQHRELLIETVRQHALASDPEYRRYGPAAIAAAVDTTRTVDYLFATPNDPHAPQAVFDRLRWGGQFVFATPHGRQAKELAAQFASHGYVIERGPERAHRWRLGIPLWSAGPRAYFFVARKVRLIPPGEYNNRFTYDVHLERSSGRYVVAKQLPELATIIERLRLRHPQSKAQELEQQARELVDVVFPIFLTREATFLDILQRELPEPYRRRVPKPIAVEKNQRGMVTKLCLKWLRKTDKTMSQIDFALQSADLLHRLHQAARIIHLDLRFDNFVITDHGVGFVDFGSAARAGENIAATPLLHRLFHQLMHSSQVQRMLEKMTADGKVTSRFLTCARHKVDRAVDLFFLTAQLDRPDLHPYVREVVLYHSSSHEAKLIRALVGEVLRPADPLRPTCSSARDLLLGLAEIKQRLGTQLSSA